MSLSRSKYVVCSPWEAKPFHLDIYTWQDKPDGYFFNYWVRIFQEFEKCSTLSGLTFYLVCNHDRVDELPSYGDNVVAVIRSDEECWFPPYLNKVRCVFKTYGFAPWCGASLQSPASVLKCARDWGRWSWHYLSYLRESGFSRGRADRKMVVPLGYARQTDLPGKPFEIAPLPGRISREHRKPGIFQVFAQEARRFPEGYRSLADGGLFGKNSQGGARRRLLWDNRILQREHDDGRRRSLHGNHGRYEDRLSAARVLC